MDNSKTRAVRVDASAASSVLAAARVAASCEQERPSRLSIVHAIRWDVWHSKRCVCTSCEHLEPASTTSTTSTASATKQLECVTCFNSSACATTAAIAPTSTSSATAVRTARSVCTDIRATASTRASVRRATADSDPSAQWCSVAGPDQRCDRVRQVCDRSAQSERPRARRAAPRCCAPVDPMRRCASSVPVD